MQNEHLWKNSMCGGKHRHEQKSETTAKWRYFIKNFQLHPKTCFWLPQQTENFDSGVFPYPSSERCPQNFSRSEILPLLLSIQLYGKRKPHILFPGTKIFFLLNVVFQCFLQTLIAIHNWTNLKIWSCWMNLNCNTPRPPASAETFCEWSENCLLDGQHRHPHSWKKIVFSTFVFLQNRLKKFNGHCKKSAIWKTQPFWKTDENSKRGPEKNKKWISKIRWDRCRELYLNFNLP